MSQVKTVNYGDLIDELPEDSIELNYVVSPDSEVSPYANLLIVDLMHAEIQAGLTLLQTACFRLWCKGISEPEIARLVGRRQCVVHNSIRSSLRKMDKVEVGAITVLVESAGWKAARDIIADVLEEINGPVRRRKNAKM